jgi:hypothetical protein
MIPWFMLVSARSNRRLPRGQRDVAPADEAGRLGLWKQPEQIPGRGDRGHDDQSLVFECYQGILLALIVIFVHKKTKPQVKAVF